MKIVYFTDLSLFAIGGVSNSLLNLSSALKKEGHKVIIFAPKSNVYNKRALRGISVDFLPSIALSWNPRLRISAPLSPILFSKIKEIDPDIIHFHTPFLTGASALVLGKTFKKPVVGTFHTYFMHPQYLKAAGIKTKTASFTKFLWKYAIFFYNQCDAVIAPAQSVINDLKKNGLKKPVYVISNPIDESRFKSANIKQISMLRKKLKLKRKVLLYVGRLSYEKSLDILIKSFAKVARAIDDVSLLLVGDGQIKGELKLLAKKLEITDKVVFAGSIDQQKLFTKGYYQLADVFTTASESETQGISLIEAMYFGVPLVGVSKKGVMDMVKDVGLLSRPKNVGDLAKSILRILNNPALRKKLAKISKQTFGQKYSSQKNGTQFVNLYQRLVRPS